MIRINLLNAERKVAKKRIALFVGRRLVLVSGFILVLGVGLVGWRYWAIGRDSKQLDQDIEKARQETVQLQSLIAQVQQFEKQKAQLQQRVQLIEQLRKNQTGPVHMLDQISRSLPPMLWLTELKQGPSGEVVVDGKWTTLTSLSDFVANLEATGYFKKSVEIISSQTESLSTPPGTLISFQIKAVFQQPVEAKPAVAAAPAAAPAAKPAN